MRELGQLYLHSRSLQKALKRKEYYNCFIKIKTLSVSVVLFFDFSIKLCFVFLFQFLILDYLESETSPSYLHTR